MRFLLRIRSAVFFSSALALSGCGLFYKHSRSEASFTLYSDRSETFLERVAAKVNRIYEGYGKLFEVSRGKLGRPAIVLEGEDSGVVDFRHVPDILGYYLPFLNLISVDAAEDSQGEETLDQVLLHEIAHHFIVTEWPPASSECWLNEGLAGALEVSVFDEQRFECPLLNPTLFQIAQHAVYSQEPSVSLGELIHLTWGQFHSRDAKERNYALAWSAVYFLLERKLSGGMPLGQRIDDLYRLDREEIAGLEPEWIQFLRSFDLNGKLLQLAARNDPEARLTRLWAVRTMGSLRTTDDLRLLEGLIGFFDSADPAVRAEAQVAFTEKLERSGHSYFLEQEIVRRGMKRVAQTVLDPTQPGPLRSALVDALGSSPRLRTEWIPFLVQILEEDDGEIRARAAHALSRIARKPTIVNPEFWRDAPWWARDREVAEWRAWVTARSEPEPASSLR